MPPIRRQHRQNGNTPQAPVSGYALVLGVALIIVVSMICATVVTVLAPDQAATFVTVISSNSAGAILLLVNLVKTQNVAHQVDELANGLMDAKVRSGVADVLEDELVDDDAGPQLVEDRQRLADHTRKQE